MFEAGEAYEVIAHYQILLTGNWNCVYVYKDRLYRINEENLLL